ncbi:MAG: CaiB/BaiF CoA transferase family protein, partial [Chloroflexota bacterium]
GYDAVRERNPRLVYCAISGFGTHGAGADLAGFDQSAQAMSGLMSVTGTEATGPLRVGIPLGDSATGVFAAFGIVAALYARERTGTGQRVEASLIESLVSLLSYQAQKYLTLSEVAGQDGNDHPLMFPQGTFATQDTPITLASGNDGMWRRLCAVIGLPALADDNRFTDNARRMRNRTELRRLMEERLVQRPAAEWLPLINGAGIPAAPIHDIAQALDSEIVRGLGMVATIDHPLIGPLEVLGRPVTIGESREGWLHHPPPLLGEHTTQVLREMGQTTEQIEALVEAGVVR